MALLGGRLAAGAVTAMLAVALCVPGTASATTPAPDANEISHRYVALGDSYTASPLTGMPIGEPVGCGRTQNNYPRLVAAALQVTEFADVSCGSATINNLTTSQTVIGGNNPAQLDALKPETTLVTLGIGGNDLGLVGWMQRCVTLDLRQSSCVDQWSPGDADVMVQRIDKIAIKVDEALQAIHARSPRALVMVIGYPVVAPSEGIGCIPELPIDNSDVAYLRDLQQRLNTALSWDSYLDNATYVDTYTTSIGHGPCEPDGVKWIEGVVPDVPAAALHPNALGQMAMAADVLTALAKHLNGSAAEPIH
jgi:lysophospholipase L1-like esterase